MFEHKNQDRGNVQTYPNPERFRYRMSYKKTKTDSQETKTSALNYGSREIRGDKLKWSSEVACIA